MDDTGSVIAPGDITGQCERIFELIRALLAAHGATFADVLHVRAFLTNIADLPGYGAVRRQYFPNQPPASTSGLFLPGLVIEVEVTAAVPASR